MKPITAVVVVLLSIVSALQLIRFVLSWEVSVNGMSVPIWASAIFCVVTGALAVLLWRENRQAN